MRLLGDGVEYCDGDYDCDYLPYRLAYADRSRRSCCWVVGLWVWLAVLGGWFRVRCCVVCT